MKVHSLKLKTDRISTTDLSVEGHPVLSKNYHTFPHVFYIFLIGGHIFLKAVGYIIKTFEINNYIRYIKIMVFSKL